MWSCSYKHHICQHLVEGGCWNPFNFNTNSARKYFRSIRRCHSPQTDYLYIQTLIKPTFQYLSKQGKFLFARSSPEEKYNCHWYYQLSTPPPKQLDWNIDRLWPTPKTLIWILSADAQIMILNIWIQTLIWDVDTWMTVSRIITIPNIWTQTLMLDI